MTKAIRILIAVAFSLLVISAIFFFSEQKGGDSHKESGKIAEKLSEMIVSASKENSYTDYQKKTLTIALDRPIRKFAHLFIYFCLGFILYLSAVFIQKDKRRPIFILVCLFIVIGIAFVDEINQFYTEGRGSSMKDILIDTAGGAAGIYFYYIITDLIGHIKSLFKKQEQDKNT